MSRFTPALLLLVAASAGASASCPMDSTSDCLREFANIVNQSLEDSPRNRSDITLVVAQADEATLLLTHRAVFSRDQFEAFTGRSGKTRESYLQGLRERLRRHDCSGPARDLISRGAVFRHVTLFSDGSKFDEYAVADCDQ